MVSILFILDELSLLTSPLTREHAGDRSPWIVFCMWLLNEGMWCQPWAVDVDGMDLTRCNFRILARFFFWRDLWHFNPPTESKSRWLVGWTDDVYPVRFANQSQVFVPQSIISTIPIRFGSLFKTVERATSPVELSVMMFHNWHGTCSGKHSRLCGGLQNQGMCCPTVQMYVDCALPTLCDLVRVSGLFFKRGTCYIPLSQNSAFPVNSLADQTC